MVYNKIVISSNIENELKDKKEEKPIINNRNSMSKYIGVKISTTEGNFLSQQNNEFNMNQDIQQKSVSDTSNNSNQKINEETQKILKQIKIYSI